MVALRRYLTLALPLVVLFGYACLGYAQEAASDQAKGMLDKGMTQFKALEFKSAKETLLKVDRTKLTEADKKVLDDFLVKVDPAIREQSSAMEAFKSAETSLTANELDKAREGYAKAAASEYLPQPMRKTATTQLALVDERIKLASAAKNVTVPTTGPESTVPVKETPTVAKPPVQPPTPTGVPSILRRQEELDRVARQEADLEIQKAVTQARERVHGAESAAGFDAASDAARVGLNVLETNKNLYTTEDYRAKLSELTELQTWVGQQKEAFNRRKVGEKQHEIDTAIKDQERRARRERQMRVDQLVARAKTLIRESNFDEGLQITQEILKLDPNNRWANDNELMLKQCQILKKESTFNKERIHEEQLQWTDIRETEIPWYDILKYPKNWRELTLSRDRFSASTIAESESDRAANQKLKQVIPRLAFDDTEFQNVVTFLRDVSGTNINVDWGSLATAGVDKTTRVTVHLNNVTVEKALRVILNNLTTTTQLSFVVDEGVITISTKDVVSKNTVTRTYDINDLLVRIPNYSPQTTNFTVGNGGGGNNGGSGSGGGLFPTGNNTSNAGEENVPTRGEMVAKIIETIMDTVDPDSWRGENRTGNVGTIKELNGTLIVTQTAENQAALRTLINQLREAQQLQVAIEARFITVDSAFLESVGLNLDFIFNMGSRLGANQVLDPLSGPVTTPYPAAGTVLTPYPLDPFTGQRVLNTSSPSGWPNNSGNDHWTPNVVKQGFFDPTTGGGFTGINNLSPPGGGGIVLTNPAVSMQGTFLDDFQVNYLIQATQANQYSRLLTAPRLTVYNGHRAFITVGQQRAYVANFTPVISENATAVAPQIGVVLSGAQLDVEATVSADRRYVTLNITPTVSTLDNLFPLTFNGNTIQLPLMTVKVLSTVCICPDGGTLLLGGQKTAGQVEHEEGVPVLSKIPILNRAFNNRGMQRAEETLLIFIKPKIIITTEAEEQAFPPE